MFAGCKKPGKIYQDTWGYMKLDLDAILLSYIMTSKELKRVSNNQLPCKYQIEREFPFSDWNCPE
jgi:hypothetical protein